MSDAEDVANRGETTETLPAHAGGADREKVVAPAPREPPIGTHGLGRGALVDRYLVLSPLGQGGMGVVYTAYDPELDRRVALKLLNAARGLAAAKQRLIREARTLGKLSHPNVVQVYDVGEHQGNVFIAMELIEGASFDAWCSAQPAPSWREILAAYLDVARGLHAAHLKGIIHRDIKPSNLLRDKGGRPRVVDFGLAAASEDDALPTADTLPSQSATSAHDRLTATGAVLGTPLYMAPEQHTGARVGPASDQFSLCASLYEGLYGEAPFRADTGPGLLNRLHQRKLQGLPPSPPAGSSVPAWIHKVVARGLAPKPEERFPSLGELIAALSDDPQAKRRSPWLWGVAAAAMGALALTGLGWTKGAPRNPCAHPERELADVWDAGVRERMRGAFVSTGKPYAEDVATRATAALDEYGSSWAAMRREICEASRKDTARHEVLAIRDRCLDRRRAQLQSLTSLFADKPDVTVLGKATQAVAGLYPIAYCSDVEALTARVRPPEDPTLRARVAALQPSVDRLEVLHLTGKYKEGLALGDPLLPEVRATPYAPLRAQAEYWMGRLNMEGTGDYERAKALLSAAIVSAAQGRDDVLVAKAWASLLSDVGYFQARHEDAAMLRTLGLAAVARAHDDEAEGLWLNAEGTTFLGMDKYAEAEASFERAFGLFEKALRPDHPYLYRTLSNLGVARVNLGETAEAKAAYERALAMIERSAGPRHPDLALVLQNLGSIAGKVGDYARARPIEERALGLMEDAFGPDHPRVSALLVNLGETLLYLGDLSGAAQIEGRAVALIEKRHRSDDPSLSEPLTILGRVQVRLGQLDAAAAALERSGSLEKNPRKREWSLGLAELALARRDPERAVLLLERTLADDHSETPLTAEIRLTLAEALWQRGKSRQRARALADEARMEYERMGHPLGRDQTTRWLIEHPEVRP